MGNSTTEFKKLYHDIESDMIRYQCGTSKRFTQKWLKMYADCLRNRIAVREAIRNGAEDTDTFISKKGEFETISEGITLHRSWIPVYKSAFYRKDSASYCGFLCASLKYEDKLLEVTA